MKRLGSPLDPRPAAAWLALLALAAAWPAAASTLLTNGAETQFRRIGVRALKVVNGEEGFTVLVPPGAESLRVELFTDAAVELRVRAGVDVAGGTSGRDAADWPNGRGVAAVEFHAQGHPRLRPGLYFVGFMTRDEAITEFSGGVRAVLSGGPVENLFTVVESNFDSDAEGWTLNGANDDSLAHFESRGNPGGLLAARSSGDDDFFTAPEAFLVNLLELADGRLEFDLARLSGPRLSTRFIEARVVGPGGGWKFVGGTPPPLPTEFNFFSGQVDPLWKSFSVPIRKDLWRRFEGSGEAASFEATMANPLRVEILATLTLSSGTTGLDNVRIRARGQAPAKPVLPTISSFSGGLDGWSRNERVDPLHPAAAVGSAESRLLWAEDEGNPGGRLVLAGGADDPTADVLVAPAEFLGDYSTAGEPRFEFDYRHASPAGASRPVVIRLYGAGAAYEWRGVPAVEIWGRQIAPLRADVWTRVAGEASFEEAVSAVTRLEVGADLADGVESDSLDNFAFVADGFAAPPLSLTVLPGELAFSAAVGDPGVPSQTLAISASGPPARWGATVSGAIADRVQLSSSEGEPSAEVEVSIDPRGLPAGDHEFEIVARALGTSAAPVVVPARLTLASQPFPTPRVDAVSQAASFEARLAPGALGTIFGSNFAAPSEGVSNVFGGRRNDQLPTTLGALRVLIRDAAGEFIAEAPALYADPGQINFQMPFEVEGRSEVRVAVANGHIVSEPLSVPLGPAAPGVFTFGDDHALAFNADGALNAPASPAARGSALTVYLTGQGRVSPEWPTGRAAGSQPLLFVPKPARVLVGGVEARILFLGLAPRLVGVLQLNVEPAPATPAGEQPLVLVLDGAESNAATLSLR